MNELIGFIGFGLIFSVIIYAAYILNKPHKFQK